MAGEVYFQEQFEFELAIDHFKKSDIAPQRIIGYIPSIVPSDSDTRFHQISIEDLIERYNGPENKSDLLVSAKKSMIRYLEYVQKNQDHDQETLQVCKNVTFHHTGY